MSTHTVLGTTRCGKRHSQNEDCIAFEMIDVENCEPMFLLAVADGVTGKNLGHGGETSKWFIKHLVDELKGMEGIPEDCGNHMQSLLSNLSAAFQKEFAQDNEDGDYAAAFAVAIINNRCADCFWAGDVSIYLNKGKKYSGSQITTMDHDRVHVLTNWFGKVPFEPHHTHIKLNDGDVLSVASDGANVDQYVLQHYYKKDGVTQATLTTITDLALRSPRADDVSLCAFVC